MKTIMSFLIVFVFAFFFSCKKTNTSTTLPSGCVQGAINPNCLCPLASNPVCGCNNKTYDNACLAICDGITTYTTGKCP